MQGGRFYWLFAAFTTTVAFFAARHGLWHRLQISFKHVEGQAWRCSDKTAFCPAKAEFAVQGDVRRIGFLFTNDLHSCAERSYAHLSGMIAYERERMIEQGRTVVVLDSGDFFSGSLIDLLGPNEESSSTPELDFFSYNQYSAVILGNHAFDSGAAGLAQMLRKANHSGANMLVLGSNLVIEEDSALAPFISQEKFVKVKVNQDGSVKDLTGIHIVQGALLVYDTDGGKDGPVIGLLGVDGPDAAICSYANRPSTRFVGFDDLSGSIEIAELAQHTAAQAAQLRQHGADIVALVFHGGPPEDIDLGLHLLGDVDVILGGHTHSVRYAFIGSPEKEPPLPIAQCGADGSHLGVLELDFARQSQAQMRAAVALGPDSLRRVNEFGHVCAPKPQAESNSLAALKMSEMVLEWKKELVERMQIDMDRIVLSQAADGQAYFSDGDGILDAARKVADATLHSLNAWLREHRKNEPQVDIYIQCPECIRQAVTSSNGMFVLTLGDVYDLVSISGSESVSSFWMRKQDIALIIQAIRILEKTFSERFALALSTNVEYEENPWGIPFVNRVSNLRYNNNTYEKWPPLLRVAMPRFVAPYFLQASDMSWGYVSDLARYQDGSPLRTKLVETTSIEKSPPEFLLLADFFAQHMK